MERENPKRKKPPLTPLPLPSPLSTNFPSNNRPAPTYGLFNSLFVGGKMISGFQDGIDTHRCMHVAGLGLRWVDAGCVCMYVYRLEIHSRCPVHPFHPPPTIFSPTPQTPSTQPYCFGHLRLASGFGTTPFSSQTLHVEKTLKIAFCEYFFLTKLGRGYNSGWHEYLCRLNLCPVSHQK